MGVSRRPVCWIPIALALVALAPSGCGRRHGDAGAISQLRQVRLMTAPDSKNGRCFVVAEIANAGTKPVRRAKVTVTLMSAGGKLRGVNHHFVEDVKPGEHRTFSLTVQAHGSFREVQLTFHDPNEK
jgi:hypothetical protein